MHTRIRQRVGRATSETTIRDPGGANVSYLRDTSTELARRRRERLTQQEVRGATAAVQPELGAELEQKAAALERSSEGILGELGRLADDFDRRAASRTKGG